MLITCLFKIYRKQEIDIHLIHEPCYQPLLRGVSIVGRVSRSTSCPGAPCGPLLRISISIRRCPRHEEPSQQSIIVTHSAGTPCAVPITVAPFTPTTTFFAMMMTSCSCSSRTSHPITAPIIPPKTFSATPSPVNSA